MDSGTTNKGSTRRNQRRRYGDDATVQRGDGDGGGGDSDGDGDGGGGGGGGDGGGEWW
ncbi:hypothetical protein K0M31_010683 [Melipona bicolor]|uniref:Uncharacterized protein n=1 Tax=Melipona bicolor TaxID=60889 RepID=A0AA40KHU5_9HYME|nr:hypothetical protein K0M31_010683 [Melipona bicolor]